MLWCNIFTERFFSPYHHPFMKVTILGNNSALPAYGRYPTSQVVSLYGQDILIDCGEGTQIRMQQYGVRWRHMEHIFISHLHGDHYFGIFGLLTSMSLLGRTTALHLYAPAPLEGLINAMLAVASTDLGYPFFFHPLPEGAGLLVDHKLFTAHCFPVEHRIPCHGFVITRKTRGRKLLPDKAAEAGIPAYFYDRLKAGEDYTDKEGRVIQNELVTEDGPSPKRYAYCADTIYTDSFLEHIRGVDMLYHESTYLSDNEERAASRFHSTAAQAAMIAQKAGARQLLLGHYSSKYRDVSAFAAEAAQIFPNVMASVEGAAYEL
jgi:ribonuclease Z